MVSYFPLCWAEASLQTLCFSKWKHLGLLCTFSFKVLFGEKKLWQKLKRNNMTKLLTAQKAPSSLNILLQCVTWGRTRGISLAQSKCEADRWSLVVWLTSKLLWEKLEGRFPAHQLNHGNCLCSSSSRGKCAAFPQVKMDLAISNTHRESLAWKKHLKANNEVNQQQLMRDSSQGLWMAEGTNTLV